MKYKEGKFIVHRNGDCDMICDKRYKSDSRRNKIKSVIAVSAIMLIWLIGFLIVLFNDYPYKIILLIYLVEYGAVLLISLIHIAKGMFEDDI